MSGTINSNQAKKEEHIINAADLPLSCPTPEMTLWNAHPRVFLPIEREGKVVCPYCGTCYVLKDKT